MCCCAPHTRLLLHAGRWSGSFSASETGERFRNVADRIVHSDAVLVSNPSGKTLSSHPAPVGEAPTDVKNWPGGGGAPCRAGGPRRVPVRPSESPEP